MDSLKNKLLGTFIFNLRFHGLINTIFLRREGLWRETLLNGVGVGSCIKVCETWYLLTVAFLWVPFPPNPAPPLLTLSPTSCGLAHFS